MTAHQQERAWRWQMAGVVGLGLAVRLAAVLGRLHWPARGDPAEYLGQANLLAQGKGFIEPVIYAATHHSAQTAKLPPLYIMVLALCSLVGFKSFLAHRIWSAFIGASAVALAALVGREIGGRRVGLLAAVLLAVYPNFWMSDSLGMSETLSPVLTLLVLWAAYRMHHRPTLPAALWLGAAIGLAALGRDELILLAAFILVPLAIGGRGRRWPVRIRLMTAGTAGCLLLVGPWVSYNMIRFTRPVLITDRFGTTLAVANCDAAWHGPLAGYWSFACGLAADSGVTGDESVQDAAAARHALGYLGAHAGGVPAVEVERLGRTLGFYQPFQQIRLDVTVEGRPRVWAFTGLWMFYGLVVLSVPGVLILRRRGAIVYPLLAVGGDVVVTVLLTYGQTRFRVPFDVVLVLLAAVTIDGFSRRGRDRSIGPGQQRASAASTRRVPNAV